MQVTARTTGILPSEAVSFARMPSVDRMEKLATLPPSQRLVEAHEARFRELPPECFQAARRILCFSLPIIEDEAESLFFRLIQFLNGSPPFDPNRFAPTC